VQAPIFPLMAVRPSLAVRCLTGKGFAYPSLMFVYPDDGTPGQSASHTRENRIMAWPPDNIDLPALLLLDVLDGMGLLTAHWNPRLGPPAGGLQPKEP
jgi:hypothetical protein